MSPLAVISLLRMMRLCGNSERAVWIWLRTAVLLVTSYQFSAAVESVDTTYSLMPARISRMML